MQVLLRVIACAYRTFVDSTAGLHVVYMDVKASIAGMSGKGS